MCLVCICRPIIKNLSVESSGRRSDSNPVFYYTVGRLILPLLIQCILSSLVQNGLRHCDICMRNCSGAQSATVSFQLDSPFFFLGEKCQDNPPVFGQCLFFFFFLQSWSWGTTVHSPNKLLHRFNLRAAVSTLSINADKRVFGDACVHGESLLHAVLPRDGVAVLRVVQERHIDSDQRRPVSREDLTSDY